MSSSKLGFADPQVSAAGVSVPDALTNTLSAIFQPTINLAALPFGLTFTAITATPSGVVVSLRGNDVVYDSRSN